MKSRRLNSASERNPLQLAHVMHCLAVLSSKVMRPLTSVHACHPFSMHEPTPRENETGHPRRPMRKNCVVGNFFPPTHCNPASWYSCTLAGQSGLVGGWNQIAGCQCRLEVLHHGLEIAEGINHQERIINANHVCYQFHCARRMVSINKIKQVNWNTICFFHPLRRKGDATA